MQYRPDFTRAEVGLIGKVRPTDGGGTASDATTSAEVTLAYSIQAYLEPDIPPDVYHDSHQLARIVQRVCAASAVNKHRRDATPDGARSDGFDIVLAKQTDIYWCETNEMAKQRRLRTISRQPLWGRAASNTINVPSTGNGDGSGDVTENEMALRCRPFTLPAQTLSCVQGVVGAGKSTFLLSLLGETFTPQEAVTFRHAAASANMTLARHLWDNTFPLLFPHLPFVACGSL